MTTSPPLYAHTPPKSEPEKWHLLEDHLRGVAELAEKFAAKFGAGNLGRCLGLLHDVGKASDGFQGYPLRAHEAAMNRTKPPSKSVDHKLAGTMRAMAFGDVEELLAIPIIEHHGGMMSPSEVRAKTNDPRAAAEIEQALERVLPLVQELLVSPKIPEAISKKAESCEMPLRMFFSCLVDADYLDTEHRWGAEKS